MGTIAASKTSTLMKSLFLRTALLLFTFIYLPFTAWSAAVYFEKDGLYYRGNDGSAVVYASDTDISGTVTIPVTIKNDGRTYVVREIGGEAFANRFLITEVVIGDSVQTVQSYAFMGCQNISKLTVGRSVIEVGDGCFVGCMITTLNYNAKNCIYFWQGFHYESSTIEQVVIGRNVETIPYSFCANSRISEVAIPASVKTISEDAFSGCANLKKVTFPSSTGLLIERDAFCRCGFQSIIIPSTLTAIGTGCFSGCPDLQSITVADGNPNYDSRGNCNAIIETSTNTLVTGCVTTRIPNSVEVIGQTAFSYLENLTSIEIPEGIKEIRGSFHDTGLRHVVVPNSVKYITSGPSGGTFRNCKQLLSVIIGDSVELIDWDTFRGCENLIEIQMPDNVKIVSGVDYIYGGPFQGAPWYDNQSDGMIYIGKAAFHYKGIMPYDTKIVIPEGTFSISEYAFANWDEIEDHNCLGLTGIIMPKSLKWIGDRAFTQCSELTEVVIPDSVIMIGCQAFEDCDELKSVTIGSGVKVIAEYVFYGCKNLTSVTCLASVPPMIKSYDGDPYEYILTNQEVDIWEPGGWECFDEDTYTNAILYVPKGTEAVYRLTDPWKKFIHIVGIDINADACDVNGDGVVNISDLNNVINDILAGNGAPSMDVNGDGSVNISDINVIVQTILTAN